MKKLLTILILLICSTAGAVENGSVIFWHGGLLVGPIFDATGSKLTHVAIMLDGDVYEATPPCVRKMPFNKYVQHLQSLEKKPFWIKRDFQWFIVQPKNHIHGLNYNV